LTGPAGTEAPAPAATAAAAAGAAVDAEETSSSPAAPSLTEAHQSAGLSPGDGAAPSAAPSAAPQHIVGGLRLEPLQLAPVGGAWALDSEPFQPLQLQLGGLQSFGVGGGSEPRALQPLQLAGSGSEPLQPLARLQPLGGRDGGLLQPLQFRC
jgi:hypothetical protein